MKTYFVSFADTKYRRTLERIKNEADNSNCFDITVIMDETDLSPDFLERNGEFIKNNPRGYGYWIWKPQVCIQMFKKMEYGDILVYADAGCTINFEHENVHKTYLNCAKTFGSVSFSLQTIHPEKRWCKMNLVNYLGANKPEYIDTPQILATTFYLKKTEENELLKTDS